MTVVRHLLPFFGLAVLLLFVVLMGICNPKGRG